MQGYFAVSAFPVNKIIGLWFFIPINNAYLCALVFCVSF